MATTINQYTKEQNPWYSFRPYQENDVDKFKGRGRDIAEVMKYILGNDFVVCYAKSGIGKSSLINAGLMPRLRKKQILPILIKFTEDFFATDSFERNIRNQIVSEIDKLNDNAKEEGRDDIYSFIKHPSIDDSPVMKAADAELADDSIWWWLSTYQLICKRGEFDIIYQPIMIFDQFEELFQKTQTDEQRKFFFEWLQKMSLTRPSEDIQIKLQHIQNLYPDNCVSLPNNCGWKIFLSLREDYIGLLDYWCIQRIRIPEIQDNRYCLMPLTKEQAEEVVSQQSINGKRVEILDKYKQIIIDSLIETDGVPAVLLSVLCNRLFNEEISGFTSTVHRLSYISKISENNDNNEQLKKVIRALIRSVYEERIREAKVSKRLVNKVEQALVRDNGTRRRPELSEFSRRQQEICLQLANVYLIRIDDFGEKNGEKVRYVEIIHDRVAEVIADKRHEISKKTRVLWSRVGLVIGFVLLFGFTYWNQFWTYDDYKAKQFPYMEYRDGNKEGTATHYSGVCNNLWSLKTLICDTSITVSNCPSLETIDASNYKEKELKIIIHNCNQLKYIILNDIIMSLTLKISGCPQVKQIELPKETYSLDLNISSDRVSFKVPENSRYLWSDGILWDKSRDSILYVRSDAAQNNIDVPYTTNKKYYSYHPLTFNVMNTDTIELHSYSISSGKEYTRRISRDAEEIDLSNDSLNIIPSGLFSNMKNLKSIKFPLSLTLIGSNAFNNCINLSQIVFNDSSSIGIGHDAFSNCKNLKTVKFPKIVALETRAFDNCSSLEEIHFGKIGSISDFSFRRCSSLKIVGLPSTFQTLYGHAFSPNAFVGCLNIERFDGDTAFWSHEPDSSVIYKLNHEIILTNRVKYHTYMDSAFSSKNGILYYHNHIFNEPIELSEGRISIMNGKVVVNNKDNPYSMNLPLMPLIYPSGKDTVRTIPEFLISPSNLKELHYPYSNMVDESIIDYLLPNSIKENVTIFIPYGCIKYFTNNDTFNNFKEIREETWLAWGFKIFKHHLESGLSVVSYYNFFGLIISIIIISTILLSWYVYYRKRRIEGVVPKNALVKIVSKSFATVILGPCFWYILYWFVFLSIIPLFHIDSKLYASPWLFVPCAFVAGLIAFIAVYLILYSDGLNFKGLGAELKENAKTIKQFIIYIVKHPKKIIKPLFFILLPLLFYFFYIGYNDYKEERLRNASIKINEQVSLAQSHPNDALNILFDAWEETHNVIKGEEPEHVIFNAVYQELIKKELMDTCFSNIRASYIAITPDNKLLFADYWKDKTGILQENNDTIHLLSDDYNWYKFDLSGRFMMFGKYGTYVMDYNTRQIDTLKIVGKDMAFIGKEHLISYKDGKTIRFYDVDKKRDNAYKPIYLNHYTNGLCYCDYNECLATIADRDTILFHKFEKNRWLTDTIAKNLGHKLKNPAFIGNEKFAIQIGDTLKVWPISHIGDSGYQQYWVIGSNDLGYPYSSNGMFYITAKDNVLIIYDLAETEKVYLTLVFPCDITSACFSHDGQYLYVADNYNISRIRFMSPEQIFKELKRIVSD